MNSSSGSSRAVSALATTLWPIFVAISLLLAFVWLTGFGHEVANSSSFAARLPNRDLRKALGIFAHAMDPTWMTLASILTYLTVVRGEGLAKARYWCALTIGAGFAVAIASVAMKRPLGPVFFPENLGWKAGPVPFAYPLLWLVVVLGAREMALRFLPRSGHGGISVATAIGSLATIANLDPLAAGYRAWWVWYPWPAKAAPHAPIANYLTWFILPFILAWLMRSSTITMRSHRFPVTAVAPFMILNAIAILTHLTRWLNWSPF